MNRNLLIFQFIMVLLIVVANLVAEAKMTWLWYRHIRRWLHKTLSSKEDQVFLEELEGAVLRQKPWYCTAQIELGMVEMALAITAVSMALPAFVESSETIPRFILVGFQVALLLSAGCATYSAIWFYRIYVGQLTTPIEVRGAPRADAEKLGNPFLTLQSGPYGLLGYAMILLLIGISLLALIVLF